MMDYLIHVHISTISINGIIYFVLYWVAGQNFYKMVYSVAEDFVFTLANSADPCKIQLYAAFHLGLHCLPKYLITGIQNVKG